MVAITLVNAEVAKACQNNPGFQIAWLRCTTESKIFITNVSVGTSWSRCDDHYCSYHTIPFVHLYFMNATKLYELSKIEPFIFHICGNSTPSYINNYRNKVEVQYICSGKYVTKELQTLFLVHSNYEPSNNNFAWVAFCLGLKYVEKETQKVASIRAGAGTLKMSHSYVGFRNYSSWISDHGIAAIAFEYNKFNTMTAALTLFWPLILLLLTPSSRHTVKSWNC